MKEGIFDPSGGSLPCGSFGADLNGEGGHGLLRPSSLDEPSAIYELGAAVEQILEVDQRGDNGPSESKVKNRSCSMGRSSGPSGFKRDFLLRPDNYGRMEGGCATGAHVGDFRGLDLNDYKSDHSIDGLYFDEATHVDSSKETFLK